MQQNYEYRGTNVIEIHTGTKKAIIQGSGLFAMDESGRSVMEQGFLSSSKAWRWLLLSLDHYRWNNTTSRQVSPDEMIQRIEK